MKMKKLMKSLEEVMGVIEGGFSKFRSHPHALFLLQRNPKDQGIALLGDAPTARDEGFEDYYRDFGARMHAENLEQGRTGTVVAVFLASEVWCAEIPQAQLGTYRGRPSERDDRQEGFFIMGATPAGDLCSVFYMLDRDKDGHFIVKDKLVQGPDEMKDTPGPNTFKMKLNAFFEGYNNREVLQ